MQKPTLSFTYGLLVAILATWSSSFSAPPGDPGNPGTPWPAVDGLGRALPVEAEVGPPKAGRFVGIFYFLWLGQHDGGGGGPYDVAKILRKNPDAVKTPTSPPWGPIGRYHWWAEPLYGYYLVADPWVLRRHAQLLIDAGVDTLIFDNTNRITYRPVYMKLCEVFHRIRQEGGRTPQITFMTNTRAGETAQELYQDLYRPRRYEELWFRWEGKPLLICDPAEASGELRAFFTLRRAHWPFTQVNTPFAWHWEAAYPQVYGYTKDQNVPEQVNVSVAQNLRRSDGKVTNMSRGDARGRSFHDGDVDRRTGAVNHGFNFQEQWKRALALDAPFVMVTGWNEWIAGRWERPGEPLVFVDQFDQEHSRDIEPMKGGHGDHYYWQLVANVRRYKGAPSLPAASAAKTIRIYDDFKSWRDVRPEYRDRVFDTLPRDHPGASGLRYTNRTGRNDFVSLKVARDDREVYFYARTREPITSPDDSRWMLLLIDTDRDAGTGWEGYDFVVNRKVSGVSTTWLERSTGKWAWEPVGRVAFRASGAELHLAIPRQALGLSGGTDPIAIDFKWADNLQKPGEVMDFYLSGDVAPEGRFKYRYVTRALK